MILITDCFTSKTTVSNRVHIYYLPLVPGWMQRLPYSASRGSRRSASGPTTPRVFLSMSKMKIQCLLQETWAMTPGPSNLGSPCRRRASILPVAGVPSGFSLVKRTTRRQTKQPHKSTDEGHSKPCTRNTNEENSVNVLILQEKPNSSGGFTRKRLAAAK